MLPFRKPLPHDELDAKVLAKLEAAQVDHVRVYCVSMALLVVPFTMHLVVTSLTGQPRPFTFTQDIMLLVAQTLWCTPLVLPWAWSTRTNTAVCLALAAAACAGMAAPFADANSIYTWMPGVGCTLVLQNVACRNFTVCVVTTVLFAASACSTILVHGESVGLSEPVLAVAVQLALAVISAGLPRAIGYCIEQALRRQLQNFSLSQTLEAATALLKSYTDAVVEVDVQGTIVGSSESLGGFLLRADGRSLLGRPLLDLVVDPGERAQLMSRLQAPQQDERGLAEACNIGMRDADGILLRLQICWFRFLRAEGCIRYMVGVRDTKATEVEQDVQPPVAALRWDAVHVPLTPLTSGESSRSSMAEGPVSEGPVAYPAPEDAAIATSGGREVANPSDVFVFVNSIFSQGCELEQLSPSFAARIGRPPLGTRFIDLVKRPDHFVNWFERMVTEMASYLGDEEQPPEVYPLRLTLLMVHGEVAATCTLAKLCASGGEDDSLGSGDFDQAKLVFSEIRLRHGGGALTAPTTLRDTSPLQSNSQLMYQPTVSL